MLGELLVSLLVRTGRETELSGPFAAGRALNDRPSRMETSFTLLKPISESGRFERNLLRLTHPACVQPRLFLGPGAPPRPRLLHPHPT